MFENVKKTIQFLTDTFEQSAYFQAHQDEKNYRFEHTIRVMHIGEQIAKAEGLDQEALMIGCLLHDISYADGIDSDSASKNHGRRARDISAPFLDTLTIEANLKQEILHGIAIHVDGKSDLPGENSVFSETIGDCDNIDRFDAFRLYEGMKYSHIEEMSQTEKETFIQKRIDRLKQLRELPFQTKTAILLWQDKVDFQIEYYKRLYAQIIHSKIEKTD